MAATNILRKMDGKAPLILDDRSSIGAIIKYITEEKKNFQPMGPNFGVIKSLDERIRDKKRSIIKYQK